MPPCESAHPGAALGRIGTVLPALRDPRGKPAAPMRLLAALVLLGMLALSTPVVVPLLRMAASALL